MRLKFTVFLLALNLIVFGLIAYLGKRAETADLNAGGLSGQIGREIIEADRIELRGRGLDSPRILVREGSTWSISEPMQWSANYFAVNRILNQLQFLEEEASFFVREIEDTGKSLEDYGLSDPLIELTIGDGEDRLTLSIGMLTEIGNNVYVLGPDKEQIFVVSRQVIDGLLIDLGDLRTREIFDIPVFEVEALNLQIKSPASVGNGDLKVRLARSGTGWNFEAPLSAQADPALVSNTINTLTAAKVGRFIDEEVIDPVLLGLENPFIRVTIQGNKRRQTLLVGNADAGASGKAGYFAKLEGNPSVFTVESKPFDQLREAQEALRERNFMSFDGAALTAINIREADRQIRLQRLETGDQWHVVEGNSEGDIQPRRADKGVMANLINELFNLRASGFAVDNPSPTDLERYGFNSPRRVVTLIEGEGNESTLLLAHPENEDARLYAKVNDKEVVYEVERRSVMELLSLNALYYRNRTLDVLPEAAVVMSIKLEDLQTQRAIVDLSLPDEASLWSNTMAELKGSERQQILTLMDSIRRFAVKDYIQDTFSEQEYYIDNDTAKPWRYRLTASINLPGGETQRADSREYLFTDRLSGTAQVGGSKRYDCTFNISQTLLDALYELTDSMEIPPEMNDEPVDEPATIEPIGGLAVTDPEES